MLTDLITPPRKELDTQVAAKLTLRFEVLRSLLHFRSGWSANHALHLTRRGRRGCNRCVPCAVPVRKDSLSLGR